MIALALFPLDGEHCAAVQHNHGTNPRPLQRPEDWWTAVGAAVRGAVAAAEVTPDQVAALCLDTTCCTVVALDAGEGREGACILVHVTDMRAGLPPCGAVLTKAIS